MKKGLKFFFIALICFISFLLIYAYKLHSLALEGNNLFEQRCLVVNPPLIEYKNSFLQVADYLKNPEKHATDDFKSSFDHYIAGMRDYAEKEDAWIRNQKSYVNRWDFQLFEPSTVKEAAQYQIKMYEAQRDETQAKLEL